jgi:hypothetical protein
MTRMGIIICILLMGAGCESEVTVHESSLASEFSRMNKNGWQVNSADQLTRRPTGSEPDPNVKVIRDADFSGYRFNTNFQIDDPNYPQTRPQIPLPGEPSEAPAADPFMSVPRIPGS